MLVSVQQLKKETNQFVEETLTVQERKVEEAIIKPLTTGNMLGKDENMEKRKAMIASTSIEPEDFAYERAIGKNDSLYSNFTELIALTKRKIGRIVVIENGKKMGYATGFMVSDSMMLTNWHVFHNPQQAFESEVHFFYEYDVQGHPSKPVIFRFDNSKFFNDEVLDYCLVGVQPIDVKNEFALSNISYLYLDKGLGKLGDVDVEKLNIIHHPQGDYKQISIRENTFKGIEETKIFYETDTAQGSSGSPVFNDQWQVVGLHHKSVGKLTSDKKYYIDIKGNPIKPDVDGKIDVTRIIWESNEGIRISVILKHLAEKNPNNSLITTLDVAPPKQTLNFTVNTIDTIAENNNLTNNTMNESSKNITINVPTGALSNENSIEISLFSKKLNAVASPLIESKSIQNPKMDELLLEIAKIDRENAVDFSKCKGYDTNFLGVNVPMPQPTEEIKSQIALLKDKTNELKYFKHSVIFNAVTRMPLISAVNVEGDATKRLDKSKRKDNWLRDKRIDIDVQLTDKIYALSNFDKGHMSRFEDANWDDTEADALRNGIHTCFYTNACPQVPTLNRTGFWGKLEKAILEGGIEKQEGKEARMTVFNGAIFNDATDKIFRGVRIPMEFFKIILWLDDAGKLKATAFKLSQEFLLGEVNFNESMSIDEEALDIDKNIKFKSFQCSIKSLSKLTKIDFKNLEQFDTFKVVGGNNESLLSDEKSLTL